MLAKIYVHEETSDAYKNKSSYVHKKTNYAYSNKASHAHRNLTYSREFHAHNNLVFICIYGSNALFIVLK